MSTQQKPEVQPSTPTSMRQHVSTIFTLDSLNDDCIGDILEFLGEGYYIPTSAGDTERSTRRVECTKK